jgi:hypothetical protein
VERILQYIIVVFCSFVFLYNCKHQLANIRAPACNLVYADVDGNIVRRDAETLIERDRERDMIVKETDLTFYLGLSNDWIR